MQAVQPTMNACVALWLQCAPERLLRRSLNFGAWSRWRGVWTGAVASTQQLESTRLPAHMLLRENATSVQRVGASTRDIWKLTSLWAAAKEAPAGVGTRHQRCAALLAWILVFAGALTDVDPDREQMEAGSSRCSQIAISSLGLPARMPGTCIHPVNKHAQKTQARDCVGCVPTRASLSLCDSTA
eukprot:3473231-Rhodomonas_salina.2